MLIAGGGVAGLEALLALRELAGDRVAPMLLAPDGSFRHRPLSVTEPFELGAPRSVDLLEVALEHGGTFLEDGLAAVDPDNRTIETTAGRELAYDALLIATGTRATEAVPGALTFRDSRDDGAFKRVLAELEAGEIEHLAFAVPGGSSWPLGLYELALLTAARRLEQTSITLVTPESGPLEIFGREASGLVAEMLAEAGVATHLRATPVRFEDGRLILRDSEPLACDRVVSLPLPEVPEIPGVPQQHHHGFIPIDRFCGVLTLERVYAAGDVTWFPIKQGGLATQMADSAASAIAELAGAPVDPQLFQPVLRGALFTETGPRYLRTAVGAGGHGSAARSALWWPPSKVAGKYLAPYLAARAGYPSKPTPLSDLEAPPGDTGSGGGAGHEDALAVALAFADQNAEQRDFRQALRWLEVAEDLELYLPREYEHKRGFWQDLAPPAPRRPTPPGPG